MPTVAIIGRPNTGKSTLFNALIGARKAIESPVAGTTRDRVFGFCRGDDFEFLLVDTGGLTTDAKTDIEKNMRAQAIESVAGADAIYFCVDVRSEITAEEFEIAEILRTKKPKSVPVFLVGTKSEKPNAETFLGEMTRLLAADDYFFVSAKQNIGLSELVAATEKSFFQNGFSPKSEKKADDFVAKISILGRPNAGKSTLLNALSGKKIAIASEISGTTRDQIDSEIAFEKKKFLLIDTAGIRRKSAQNRDDIERYSRLRALASLERADIAILLIDATEGVAHADQMIAGQLVESGVGVMIVFSKWDKMRAKITDEVDAEIQKKFDRGGVETSKLDREKMISERISKLRARFLRHAQSKFPFLSWAPILFLSAFEKKGVRHLFENAEKIMTERRRKISTKLLNDFLAEALSSHPPASRGGKLLRVKYGVQIGENPPAFAFFANDPDAAHFSFRRYLENRLRDVFGFWGTPIHIEIRRKSGKNPFQKESV